jgi:Ca2+-binding EF-hand superfamily protein
LFSNLIIFSSLKSKYFSEKDIEEFRQCFKLYAPEGAVTSAEKLGFIMRSLNIKPTIDELKTYFAKHKKDGNFTFEDVSLPNSNYLIKIKYKYSHRAH